MNNPLEKLARKYPRYRVPLAFINAIIVFLIMMLCAMTILLCGALFIYAIIFHNAISMAVVLSFFAIASCIKGTQKVLKSWDYND